MKWMMIVLLVFTLRIGVGAELDLIVGHILVEDVDGNAILNFEENGEEQNQIKFHLRIEQLDLNLTLKLKKTGQLFHTDYSVERWKQKQTSKRNEEQEFEKKSITEHRNCFYNGFSQESDQLQQTNIVISFCSNSTDGFLQLKRKEEGEDLFFWISSDKIGNFQFPIQIFLTPQTKQIIESEFDLILKTNNFHDSKRAPIPQKGLR